MNRADLFHRDEHGRLLKRKEGIWSSVALECVGCGTTERPHEAKGRCHRCYVKWRYATNEDNRERVKYVRKLSRIRHSYRCEQADLTRREKIKTDPRLKALRKATCAKWYENSVTKWPIGGQVQYELIPGHWVTGTIINKTIGTAHIQFNTYSEWIAKAKLRSLVERRTV